MVSYLQVESLTETKDTGDKIETVTYDMEDVRRDHKQPNDLDHAYHSGDKCTESTTVIENEGFTYLLNILYKISSVYM